MLAGSNSPVSIRTVNSLVRAESSTPVDSIPRSMAALMFCVVISPPEQLSWVPARIA